MSTGEIKDLRHRADTAINIGNEYYKQGDWQNALKYYIECLTAAQSTGYQKVEANVSTNMGLVYYRIGEYAKALDYHLKALKIYKETDYKRGIASALNNIGGVYTMLKDYDEAFSKYKESLEIKSSIDDKAGLASPLHNIGEIYFSLGQLEKAKTYFQKSLEICEEFSDDRYTALALNSLATTNVKLGELESALKYCSRSLEIRKNINDRLGISEGLHTLGLIYARMKKYDDAIAVLNQSLKIAEEINVRPSVYNVYLALYDVYKEQNDFENALKNYESYVKIEKEIFSEESNRRLQDLQTLREIETAHKEAEIYRLKNVELAELNKKLEEVNEEKNDMMRIVAHDLKNPLSGILGLSARMSKPNSQLTQDNIVQSSAEIKNTSERMIEMITKMLDASAIDSGRQILEIEDINIVIPAQRIFFDYRERSLAKDIALTFESSEQNITAKVDKKAFMQIMDNLISNAIKYSPKGKSIAIKLYTSNSNVVIEVQDEGPGFTEKDKTKLFTKFSRLSAVPTGGENSTGLGLSIVKSLTEKMNGAITLESHEGKGAKFTLTFPI